MLLEGVLGAAALVAVFHLQLSFATLLTNMSAPKTIGLDCLFVCFYVSVQTIGHMVTVGPTALK